MSTQVEVNTLEGGGEDDIFAPSSFMPLQPTPPLNGHDTSAAPPPNCHGYSDPFAADNFESETSTMDTAINDATFELGAPNDESFVRVSPEARHTATVTCLVVSRDDGYGKTFSMLTPLMKGWVSKQPSIAKFVKTFHIFLYQNQDYEYGLWPVRDALDAWSISDLQVVNTAKQRWTRRYNAGKQRKAHTTNNIDAEPVWPDFGMFTGKGGNKGLLERAFGDAFVISSPDHPTLKKLLR
jgi:hypothetical protein